MEAPRRVRPPDEGLEGRVITCSLRMIGLPEGLVRACASVSVEIDAALSLLLLSTLNLSHIGIEPCRMPTTKLVRIANWVFALFAVAVCTAVREPHAYALAGLLTIQAAMSHWTLPGPASASGDADEG